MSGQFGSGVSKFKAQMSILFEGKCPVLLQVKSANVLRPHTHYISMVIEP